MAEDILDLDVLVPEPKKVKFGGQILTVNPPKMNELMAMMKFGQKIQNADPNTTDYEPIIEEIKTILIRVVPELEGKELGINQMLALATLLSQMSTPKQAETTEEKKT